MGIIDSINKISSKAFHSGEMYAKATKAYYKLKVFQQLARSFSFLAKMAVIGGLLFLGLIFLTVSGAIFLGEIMGSTAVACLLMAGLLFLFTGIGYLLRKKIDKTIIRKMSEDFFD